MNIHLPAIFMFTRGTRFWHTAIWPQKKRMFFIVISASEGSGKRLQTENQKGGAIKVSSLLRWEMIKPNTAWLVCLVCLMMNCESHVFLRTIFYKLCMEHMYIYIIQYLCHHNMSLSHVFEWNMLAWIQCNGFKGVVFKIFVGRTITLVKIL